MIIGLTGNMGCGKTTVANLFSKKGIEPISCDAIAHKLIQNDKKIQEIILNKLGNTILGENSTICRKKLRHIAFEKEGVLDFLESVLHPAIQEEWMEKIKNKEKSFLVEIPLLFEKRLEKYFEIIICVSASEETQLKRLVAKGIKVEEARFILARQFPLLQKEIRSDFIIHNNGSPSELTPQVLSFFNRFVK